MRYRTMLLLVMGGLIAISCADDEPMDPAPPTQSIATTMATTTQPTSTSPGCGVLHEPGEYEGVVYYGDKDQPYWMVVPKNYAGIAGAPLYVHLASGGGGHDAVLDHWRPYLDDVRGLTVIVNTALGRGGTDAVAALIDQVKDEYCVDSQRVHVTGTGTSFFKAEHFSCEHSNQVASFIAALGGGVGPCAPERPVPLLTFTGDADRSGVDRLVDKWVEINGCDPEPIVEDLGSGVRRKTFQNCTADILVYDIAGMEHSLPTHEAKGPAAGFMTEYAEVDYFEEAFRFFSDHPLP